MKLKALLLVAFGAAGVGASIAVADNGNGPRGDGGCRAVRVSGTVAPQTFVVTVTHAGEHGPATGSTVTVAIGGTSQTVRANVDECTGSSGTTATVRAVDLRAMPMRPAPTTTGATTTNRRYPGRGHHHHGGTTTTSTTTNP